jgi:hypothetical protein
MNGMKFRPDVANEVSGQEDLCLKPIDVDLRAQVISLVTDEGTLLA